MCAHVLFEVVLVCIYIIYNYLLLDLGCLGVGLPSARDRAGLLHFLSLALVVGGLGGLGAASV
jgi:hypothetical protein